MADNFTTYYFPHFMRHTFNSDDNGAFLTGFFFWRDPVTKAPDIMYIKLSNVELSISLIPNNSLPQ